MNDMGAWDWIKGKAGQLVDPDNLRGFGNAIFGGGGLSADEAARKKLLDEQAAAAGDFAGYGEGGFKSLGTAADTGRARLEDIASGRLSQSSEMLRQGLQQQLATQRSMAAGVGGPMAARTAAMNMGRAGYGMSGQAALAGIAERQGAMKLALEAALQQRQQELQAALGSRQNAMTGYGAGQPFVPEKGFLEKNGQAIAAGLGIAAKSDERAKTDIKAADAKAKRIAEGLRAYTYKYKDPRDGKGEQLGVLAQDLERAGLKQAVIDTPGGKMVHGAKLAGALAAISAGQERRISKLEKKGGRK